MAKESKSRNLKAQYEMEAAHSLDRRYLPRAYSAGGGVADDCTVLGQSGLGQTRDRADR